LDKTQSIAEGNMEVVIRQSQREDAIGRLQNSFATMLQSLKKHMDDIRTTSEQTRQRNEELADATLLAQEAERQKTAFIQNVSHQIRTPLNIITGFAQVISNQQWGIPEEERKNIIDMMDHNSKLLTRMVLMLFDSSDSGLSEELKSHKHDMVACNDVAKEVIDFTYSHHPQVKINLQTEVDDDFCIRTNRLFLMRSLRELLYNSAKYSDGQHILLIIRQTSSTVRFIVEDKGKGISEADSEIIFKFFTKVDDLSEGLGLGLPLAKRHAQHLEGNLTLDTDYHDGCRFILELPLSPTA
jgi:signal transduction histidine kinase